MQADAVLHEIGHALVELAGLNADGGLLAGRREEPVVAALASGVLDVLRRNRALVAWLLDP